MTFSLVRLLPVFAGIFAFARFAAAGPLVRDTGSVGLETGRGGPEGAWSNGVPVVLSALAVGVLTGSVVIAGVTVVVALVVSPRVTRIVQSRREARRFREALPLFVEEFARGLRGGLAPSQALLDGSHALPAPFPQAFLPASTLLRAGASADEAVSAWAVARGDSSLHFLATAMAVGDAVGGIDGRSADAVAVALRERATTEAVVRMQATQALYSAGVLCAAPVVFCALVVLSDERSSAFLLKNPVGLTLGALGVALDVLGMVWMRRLVQGVTR